MWNKKAVDCLLYQFIAFLERVSKIKHTLLTLWNVKCYDEKKRGVKENGLFKI